MYGAPQKPISGTAIRQLSHDTVDSLIDRGKSASRRVPVEPFQILAVLVSAPAWTLAFDEFDLLPERIGDDQNVGEDDGRVESEPAHRLERYFGGELRIEAKIEEGTDLGSDLSIFGQIPPSLPHQPDRRRMMALPLRAEINRPLNS